MENFEAAVIGGGSGLDIASAYASKGKSVAVVEPGPLGGTCLNRGCIPSKMLIHRADVAETVRNASRFGVETSIESLDYSSMVRDVNDEVSSEAEGIREAIKSSENHSLFEKEAEFVDNHTIQAGDARFEAEQAFIAAGTRPIVPPVEGLEQVDYLTSREALKLEQRPNEIVIIGGGYIACEMAHFFGSMNVEVTIIEMGDALLGREDPDVSAKFTQLASERFDVQLGMKASRVEEVGGKLKVTAEDSEGNMHSFAGDELLVAAGRRPNTDRLKLENTGIETDENGFVETDGRLRTTAEDVWAIGDIAGNYMFKHSANYEAEIATRDAFGQEVKADFSAMPHAVFSSPQVAGVGATERELKDEGQEYRKARYDYSDTGMGLALKEEDGFVKVLASEEGEILGTHIIGPHASSLIHEAVLAMRNDLKVGDIKDTIHVHPALNEVVSRAFDSL